MSPYMQLIFPPLLRILRLYAEENAIDDTIYYLEEALRKGVIELEVFLKVKVQNDTYYRCYV